MNILIDHRTHEVPCTGYSLRYLVFLTIIHWSTETSYNRPKLAADATWYPAGVTVPNGQRVGGEPFNIFINENNTVYVALRGSNKIMIWQEGSNTFKTPITGKLHHPESVFATRNGNIYVGNGWRQPSVLKYSRTGELKSVEWNSSVVCRSIFIDSNNTIYCSIDYQHKVLALERTLFGPKTRTAAGSGYSGWWELTLNEPKGIFVHSNFSLYVADFWNGRIQMFRPGSLYGTTVAGRGASGAIDLLWPTDVALDGNGHLFIVDWGRNRIVGSGPNGFRCIIGCGWKRDPSSYLLNGPNAFSFDTHGNIYVVDGRNQRIQKFYLKNESPSNRAIFNISYNQPILSPTATWDHHGVTVMNNSFLGENPWDIFIDRQNTLYVNAKHKHEIQILSNDNVTRPLISDTSQGTWSLFVTDNGDIYVNGNDTNLHRIDKYTNNGTNRSTVMYVNEKCFGIFVDIYGSIYCSVSDHHQVVRRLLSQEANNTSVVAGRDNCTSGSSAEALSYPRSIFITVDLKIYVADCGNDRVQVFADNERSGTTVVGNTTIDMNCPVGLTIDGNGYLFVSDANNERIIGSGPNGFRCIAGCDRAKGSLSDQLSHPHGLAFDSFGNIYVADGHNHRIQKFILANNRRNTSVSYNLPQLHSCSQWDVNGTTVLDKDTVGRPSWGLFVTTNDTLYVYAKSLEHIILWPTRQTTPLHNLTNTSDLPTSIFVTGNGNLYFDSSDNGGKVVYRWTSNGSAVTPIVNVTDRCYGLFVDLYDNLYCSVRDEHQVIRKSLLPHSEFPSPVAGNGTPGSSSDMLNTPLGIFVTTNFSLYVADCGNNRIQLFLSDETEGTTVVGADSTTTTIDLSCPSSVIVDGDGRLFISDSGRHRIVAGGADGYRCVIGCSGHRGGGADQLNNPSSLGFDSVGNMYVVDYNNRRIQQFLLVGNFCAPPEAVDVFIPPACPGASLVGENCDISNTACDVVEPCLNGGRCIHLNDLTNEFYCDCPEGFNGTRCEIASNPCHADPCRNGGTCDPTSRTSFHCTCSPHWTGDLCQVKVDFCQNATCFNNGQCRPLVGGYRCECLSDRFSGQHCEKVSGSIVARQVVAKSFAYVAIIAIGIVAAFVVALDVLKYGFGIDPVGSDVEEKKKKKKKVSWRERPSQQRRKF